jgi:hypothetical protein
MEPYRLKWISGPSVLRCGGKGLVDDDMVQDPTITQTGQLLTTNLQVNVIFFKGKKGNTTVQYIWYRNLYCDAI